jgi:hypothetical protein
VEDEFYEVELPLYGVLKKFAGKVEPHDPPLRTNRCMCSVERNPNQRRR